MTAARYSTAMRSAIDETTFMLCSTMRMVRPTDTLLDQLRYAADVLVAHPLRGFVQQQQVGLERHGGGKLQRALAAVGQVDGELGPKAAP